MLAFVGLCWTLLGFAIGLFGFVGLLLSLLFFVCLLGLFGPFWAFLGLFGPFWASVCSLALSAFLGLCWYLSGFALLGFDVPCTFQKDLGAFDNMRIFVVVGMPLKLKFPPR